MADSHEIRRVAFIGLDVVTGGGGMLTALDRWALSSFDAGAKPPVLDGPAQRPRRALRRGEGQDTAAAEFVTPLRNLDGTVWGLQHHREGLM
jgi:hypothetical protein